VAVPNPASYTPYFSYRRGRLHCEQVALEAVAREVGTPVYVYSRAAIESAWRRFDRAFRSVPHTVCYSVKACSNLAVLRLLADLGSGFDIVSGGELERLLHIGVAGDRIVFSGVGKTREELRAALRAGLKLINIESVEELEMLAEEASRLGRRVPAAVRVNPDVAAGAHPHISTGRRLHKFGVDWTEAIAVYRRGHQLRVVDWQGVSVHLGSQILALRPFRQAVTRLCRLIECLQREQVQVRYVDFGGGLGVRYLAERPPSLQAYARLLASAVGRFGGHLLLEPGRSIVGPAGVLLTRLVVRKRNGGRLFYVVDAGMNDFLRPALYGAVHPITPAALAHQRRLVRADIVGPVCESGDVFLHRWPLPEGLPGELLVVWGTGAYGFVLSSNYNSRPRPAEVLVEGKRFRVIRQRESFADLVRNEIL
jgi:diaminopimelate decarboxylase